MATIYKYSVLIDAPKFSLDLPAGSKVLSVQKQGDTWQMWVFLNPTYPMRKYRFRIFGTGHPITEDPASLTHIETVQDGEFVRHIFQLPVI